MVLPAIDPELLTCARCGQEIGRLIDVEGDELVQVGQVVVREIHGNCAGCGENFDYSLNAKRLHELINRVTSE
jgi:hypothetical protein